MKQKWIERVKKLEVYLEDLKNCESIECSKLSKVPTKGIYLFLEEDKPLYIGRTNRMKDRLIQHGRQSSQHNDAGFAFRIAKEQAKNKKVDINFSRSSLCISEIFKPYFKNAKE